jgi:hypothetical protein
MNFRQAALAASIAAVPFSAFASCGAAFCSVNTAFDVQGAWTGPGARFDLRHESIRQDQPRTGSRRIAVGQVPRHHDEASTRNRNWIANFDYTFNPDWGVAVSAPLVDRDHFHVHNHRGAQLPESWKFSEPGDVRVLGRHQFAMPASPEPVVRSAGLNFGLKLPTGSFSVRNADAVLAERSLQPGTGTTDAIFGGYFSQTLPLADLSFFAQGLLQLPLNTRNGYRPGRRLSLDAGLRYQASDSFALMLQFNGLFRDKDSGVQSEPADSGGRALFASPGLAYSITQDLQAYAFLQLPLYQYVNGVQLTASKAAVLGIGAKF